jgi:hypothetical protein
LGGTADAASCDGHFVGFSGAVSVEVAWSQKGALAREV